MNFKFSYIFYERHTIDALHYLQVTFSFLKPHSVWDRIGEHESLGREKVGLVSQIARYDTDSYYRLIQNRAKDKIKLYNSVEN